MDVVKTYNLATAGAMTQEDIAAMAGLTPEQVAQLAKAYPNGPRGNNYLVLQDKSKGPREQLYTRSTWQNLLDLWNIGQTQFVPIAFSSNFKNSDARKLATAPVQDLTNEEAKSAPGLKKGQTQTARKKVQEEEEFDDEFNDEFGEDEEGNKGGNTGESQASENSKGKGTPVAGAKRQNTKAAAKKAAPKKGK